MCCNNTSIAPFFTCHMSLNPPPLKQDAGTNLVQTHSPGLGCRNFRYAGGEFNFHLQNNSTTWRLLALRISLFHLHHTACECMLRVFQSFRFCLLSWNDGLMIDGNISEFGFAKCHHSWHLIRARSCSNPLPRHSDQPLGPKPANVTREQVQHLQLLPTVANCCKLQVKTITKLTTSIYVCGCGHMHQCLNPSFFLWHWPWWNSTRCSTQILLPTLTHNVDWCWH